MPRPFHCILVAAKLFVLKKKAKKNTTNIAKVGEILSTRRKKRISALELIVTENCGIRNRFIEIKIWLLPGSRL